MCSTDQTRPTLTNAFLKQLGPREFELQATDSYCAVRIPVHINRQKGDRRQPPLAEGYITPVALKAIEKDPAGFTAANGRVEVGELSSVRPDCGQWPKFDQLGFERKAKKPLRIGLDTTILRHLAEALGSDTVVFELDMADVKAGGYTRPYRVRPLKGDAAATDAVGIMMPIRLDR